MWDQHEDEATGVPYYHNLQTDEITWEKPNEPLSTAATPSTTVESTMADDSINSVPTPETTDCGSARPSLSVIPSEAFALPDDTAATADEPEHGVAPSSSLGIQRHRSGLSTRTFFSSSVVRNNMGEEKSQMIDATSSGDTVQPKRSTPVDVELRHKEEDDAFAETEQAFLVPIRGIPAGTLRRFDTTIRTDAEAKGWHCSWIWWRANAQKHKSLLITIVLIIIGIAFSLVAQSELRSADETLEVVEDKLQAVDAKLVEQDQRRAEFEAAVDAKLAELDQKRLEFQALLDSNAADELIAATVAANARILVAAQESNVTMALLNTMRLERNATSTRIQVERDSVMNAIWLANASALQFVELARVAALRDMKLVANASVHSVQTANEFAMMMIDQSVSEALLSVAASNSSAHEYLKTAFQAMHKSLADTTAASLDGLYTTHVDLQRNLQAMNTSLVDTAAASMDNIFSANQSVVRLLLGAACLVNALPNVSLVNTSELTPFTALAQATGHQFREVSQNVTTLQEEAQGMQHQILQFREAVFQTTGDVSSIMTKLQAVSSDGVLTLQVGGAGAEFPDPQSALEWCSGIANLVTHVVVQIADGSHNWNDQILVASPLPRHVTIRGNEGNPSACTLNRVGQTSMVYLSATETLLELIGIRFVCEGQLGNGVVSNIGTMLHIDHVDMVGFFYGLFLHGSAVVGTLSSQSLYVAVRLKGGQCEIDQLIVSDGTHAYACMVLTNDGARVHIVNGTGLNVPSGLLAIGASSIYARAMTLTMSNASTSAFVARQSSMVQVNSGSVTYSGISEGVCSASYGGAVLVSGFSFTGPAGVLRHAASAGLVYCGGTYLLAEPNSCASSASTCTS